MDENNRNFIVALSLSILVFLVWHFFYVAPKQELQRERQKIEAELKKAKESPIAPKANVKGVGDPTIENVLRSTLSRDAALKLSKRIDFETSAIKGSISLLGGQIDDISLKHHRKTVDKKSGFVELFNPNRATHPFFANFGWTALADSKLNLPSKNTEWKLVSGSKLTESTPITIEYQGNRGLVFRRIISVDDKYMFTVKQQVINKGSTVQTLSPYGLLWRKNRPESESLFISHEGGVSVIDDILEEETYDDLASTRKFDYAGRKGWIGLTDKYWAAALIPDDRSPLRANLLGGGEGKSQFAQANYVLDGMAVQPGKTLELTNRLFAGAKQGRLIEAYGAELNITRFENLIDWGWFHFITKPLFKVLAYFNDLVGNFGFSILIVTVLIKLVLFPLANKSYKSMAMMKKMQPEMNKIRERYENDKMKQQQELMALYKKEKINPLSGCWPILVQIPIFFALYKVLYVTIEMRHAPFIGWIQDLSAPDPTSLFNLFGLIPIDLPQFLMIGIWPIIMGITMWVQMKLNPAPTDPIQAQIFTYMPIFFTFILASFSAGLVIYWAWNNFLSILQQYVIMKRQGVDVTLLENMGFRNSRES